MKVKIEIDIDHAKVVRGVLLEVGKTTPLGLLLNPILHIFDDAIKLAKEIEDDQAKDNSSGPADSGK